MMGLTALEEIGGYVLSFGEIRVSPRQMRARAGMGSFIGSGSITKKRIWQQMSLILSRNIRGGKSGPDTGNEMIIKYF